MNYAMNQVIRAADRLDWEDQGTLLYEDVKEAQAMLLRGELQVDDIEQWLRNAAETNRRLTCN